MRFLAYLIRLLREFCGFALHYKAWWIIPLILLLLAIALLIAVSQGAAPYVYTLF